MGGKIEMEQRDYLIGTVVKPIRNWCRVIHEVGEKVMVRHWREDHRTCTIIEDKEGLVCHVGISIDKIKLDPPRKRRKT